MPAAIKMPPTRLQFLDITPPMILRDAKRRYKDYLVEVEDDEVLENYFETDLHKRVSARLTPALYVSHLREAHGWSQARLAQEIGGISAKRISDWENGRREISKEFAKKLSKIFGLPAERFI